MIGKLWKGIKVIIRIFFIIFVITAFILGFRFFVDFYILITPRINTDISMQECELLKEEFKIELNNNEKIMQTKKGYDDYYIIKVENIENIQDFINNSLKLDIDETQRVERMNTSYDAMNESEKKNIDICKDAGFDIRIKAENSLYDIIVDIYKYDGKIYADMKKECVYSESVVEIFKDGERDLGWIGIFED